MKPFFISKFQKTYDSLLVNKLPEDVRMNLARQHGSDEWTIGELQGALPTEIRILEMDSHHQFKAISQFTAHFHAGSVHKPSRPTSDLQT